MGCEQTFIRQLRQRGLRLTPQREIILGAMHELEGFVTAEEVYARVRERTTSVDISTVYRTLELLQEFGLVACVDPGDGLRRYDLLGLHGSHMHLVCQSCGQVIGSDLAPAQSLADWCREQHGFEVDLARLSLPGLCRDCAGAARPAG